MELLRESRLYSTYLARISGTDNRCIVKVIRDTFTSPGIAERLKPDLGAVAALKNERISLLRDFGEDEGRLFVVEDNHEGLPLSEVLEPGRRFEVLRALELGIRIADAIAFAHTKGVYHGFLTPASVIVMNNLDVRLGDFFYLSVVLSPMPSGGLKEFADYAAPEVMGGAKPTFKSDVYSLGALLYILFTGVAPQRRPAVGGQPGEPVPPVELNPAIPNLLNSVIVKALRLDPAGRYDSVREMISELLLCRSTLLRAPDKQEAAPQAGETGEALPAAAPAGRPEPERQVDPRTGMVHIRTGEGRPSGKMWGGRAAEPAVARNGTDIKKYLPLIVLSGILLAIIVFTASLMSSLGIFGGPGTVVVPDVVGKPQVEAMSILGARGLEPEIKAEQQSKTVPGGHVMLQDPPAGMNVRRGRRIDLVISSGHSRVTAPNLEGVSLEEAKELLEEVQLKVGDVKREYNDEFSSGFVISQRPRAGKPVVAGTTISLIVSRGREPDREDMPSVVGMNVDSAMDALNNRGFEKIQLQNIPTRAADPGAVVSQSILGDLTVNKDMQVTLYVAVAPSVDTQDEVESVVKMKLGEDKENYRVIVRVIDQEDARDVYTQEHKPGESISVPVSGIGDTSVQVFINGVMTTQKSLPAGGVDE